MNISRCPLCASDSVSDLFVQGSRTFRECAVCDLLFIASDPDITTATEKLRYDAHRNDPVNDGYQRHLRLLCDPIQRHVPPGARGLDFGSGPSGALSNILRSSGLIMDEYDPFYRPNIPSTLGVYDFVTCCEVAEHFSDPLREFQLIRSLVRTAGTIGILTQMREGERRVPGWWYLRDITHRCFYSQRTMQALAAKMRWDIKEIIADVTIFSAASARTG